MEIHWRFCKTRFTSDISFTRKLTAKKRATLPEQRKVKFNWQLALGLITTSAILSIVPYLMKDSAKEYYYWFIALSGTALAGAFIPLLNAFVGIINSIHSIFNNLIQGSWQTRTIPAISSAEQFEELLKEITKQILEKHKVNKLVILIDELDRCDEKTRHEVFQGLKTYLKNKNIVYVVSCVPKTVNTEQNSALPNEEFLRKLFNLTFWVDGQGEENLRDYTKKLLKQANLTTHDNDLIAVLALGNTHNPRRIKHFINTLRFCLRVAEIRETQEECLQGIVTKNPAFLAKLLLIRQDWPQEFKSITRYPRILHEWSEGDYSSKLIADDLKKFLTITNQILEDDPLPFLTVTMGISDTMAKRDSKLANALMTSDAKLVNALISSNKDLDWQTTVITELRACHNEKSYQCLLNALPVACPLIEKIDNKSFYANEFWRFLSDEEVQKNLKENSAKNIFPLIVEMKPDYSLNILRVYMKQAYDKNFNHINKEIGDLLQKYADRLPVDFKEEFGKYTVDIWNRYKEEEKAKKESNKNAQNWLLNIFVNWSSKSEFPHAKNTYLLVSDFIQETLLNTYDDN
ncbi:MAG: KAP P-loop domain protein, partial [bacterium]